MSDGRPAREDAGPAPIIRSEEAFVEPEAVVYLLVEGACLDVSGNGRGGRRFMNPCPRILRIRDS